jgi:hypothetical protein
MREVASPGPSERATFAACLATILEPPLDAIPELPPGEDVAGWRVSRWLGGLGLGLVAVSDAASFSWAGPWIGRVLGAGAAEHRRNVLTAGIDGLRADVRDDGVIRVGDPVRLP